MIRLRVVETDFALGHEKTLNDLAVRADGALFGKRPMGMLDADVLDRIDQNARTVDPLGVDICFDD